MKLSRIVGTTNEVLSIFVPDATVSTGAGLANLVISTFSTYWCRNDMASTSSLTMTSTGTLGTYSSGTWTQVNSTFMKGWYQLGAPDGLFAAGQSAAMHLYGHPSMAPVPIEVEITRTDNQTYGLSTFSIPVGVSSFGIAVGVSSFNTGLQVGVSSFNSRVGVSSFGLPVGVSSFTGTVNANTIQINGATVQGDGTAGNLWRG